MRYKLMYSGLKIKLSGWALPLYIGWDRTCRKGDCVRYGVLIEFLCFWTYIGLHDTRWVKDQISKI